MANTTYTVQADRTTGIYRVVADANGKQYTVDFRDGRQNCNCDRFYLKRTCAHVRATRSAFKKGTVQEAQPAPATDPQESLRKLGF